MREFDWSTTPLGDPEDWPQSLKTTVRIMLTSRFQMWMGWGKDLTFFYNDDYAPTLGAKESSALGQPSAELWSEIWDDIRPRVDHVLQTGVATWDEGLLLLLERNGFPEETYHTFSYSPLADDDGHVAGLLCVVSEESERVIGERRTRTLRDLSTRLTGARNSAGVWAALQATLDSEGRDVPFALAYAVPEGWPEGQALTRLPDLGPQGDDPATAQGEEAPLALSGFMEAARQALSSGEPQEVEVAGSAVPAGPWEQPPRRALLLPVTPSGQEQPSALLVAGLNPFLPLNDAFRGFLKLMAGQIEASLASVNAYEQERRRAEALAEVDRAKTAFFENASHELRTPLTLMLGPLEDLISGGQGEVTPGQAQALELAHRNSLRLLRLVNTLLDFSRLDAGRLRPVFAQVDLSTLTQDVASSFRSALEQGGLNFTVQTEELPGDTFVNPEMWEKIVLNLLSNAFKFTLSGGVTVNLKAGHGTAGPEAVLTVQDTGSGIPAADLPRLFERFHRVEGQVGRSFEGTGIGLAFVKEMVGLHGGQIEVQSEVGRGTTFTVRLPLGRAHLPAGAVIEGAGSAPARTNAALPYVQEALRWVPGQDTHDADTASAAPAQGTNRKTVLLVDDNADLRDYIRRLLEGQHDVVTADNGLEALERLETLAPELVLTDVMMPGLDGFGLLRALREREETRLTPVIMLSARAGEEARLQGVEEGADDYLVKPFSGRELLAKVNAHLALAALRREALEREQAYAQELEGRVAQRAAEALQWRDRYELAVKTSGNLLFDWNPVTNEVLYGGAVEFITGYRPEELEGHLRDWTDRLIHPDDLEGFKEQIEHVIETGDSFLLPFRVIRKDGTVRYVEDEGHFIPGEPGEPQRMLGFVRDITERHEAQEALLSANNELRRSNADLERFAYTASHDLQEPIRTVGSFAGLLRMRYGEKLDERGMKYLSTIELGAERMRALVNDLLVFSRLNAAQAPLQPVDTNHPLQEALARLNATITESGADIRTGHLPDVLGDAPQLAQLFQNLVGNAVKFRRPDTTPRVEIAAQREGNMWHFTVQDNGIGVEADYQETIFNLFQRLHGRERYEGNGLGLAISRRIVERHGGTLWLVSTPGEGSTFHFTLPGT